MKKNKYDMALDAIRKVFSDTSLSVTETKMMLNDLSGEIDTMLDTLTDSED